MPDDKPTLQERAGLLIKSVEYRATVSEKYREQLTQDILTEAVDLLAEALRPPEAEKQPAKPKPKAGGGKAAEKAKEAA